nr:sugar ABC transporter permease [uncultured Sphaerochaeta sp.]
MKQLNGESKKNIWGYIFITPFFLTFIIFNLYPILYTFQLSFQQWDGFRQAQYLGLANWERLFKDGTFLLTLFNTLFIWIMDFIPQLGTALLLAMIFTFFRIKGMGFLRAVYYLPNLITAASIGLLFNLLLNGDKAPINQLLVSLHIPNAPFAFFKNGILAQLVASYILWWMWFGYTTVIVMAGVTSIDPCLYEAAELDGATKVQTFFKITIPLIRPTMVYLTITSIIGGMQIFDVPSTLTNISGDPQKALLTTSMYVYNQGFRNNSFGYASSLSVALFLIIAILSFVSLKTIQKKETLYR